MNKMKLALLAAGLLTSLPVLAQTAGGTENTGPLGTGNFVAGQTERYGVPVAGKAEGTVNLVAGQPADKMDEMKRWKRSDAGVGRPKLILSGPHWVRRNNGRRGVFFFL